MGKTLSIPEPHELPEEDRRRVLGGKVTLEAVASAIRSGRVQKVVLAVGAGISVSAGIPDFRSPNVGLYHNLEKYNLPPLPSPESLFTLDFFLEKPKAFCIQAKAMLPGKFKPTPAHNFMRLLEDKGLLARVFTQNIDGIERIAGIPPDKMVEAHGSFADVHCASPSCRKRHSLVWWRDKIMADRTPRCDADLPVVKPSAPPDDSSLEELRQKREALEAEKKQVWQNGGDWDKLTDVGLRIAAAERELAAAEEARRAYPELLAAWEAGPKSVRCGAPVKPDIVFFGEALPPRFSYLAERDGAKADLLIVMGTSLNVMPFAGILGRVGPLCPRLLLNREAVGQHDQEDPPMFFGNVGFRFDSPDNYRDVFVEGEIDAAVERLCGLLGWGEDLRKLSEAQTASEQDGFEIFRRAQENTLEFDRGNHNHCHQLMCAMDANSDGIVSREEFDSARAVLAAAGQDFLPEFEDFIVDSDKDAPLGDEAFVRSLKRLFEILGPKAFHKALEEQLQVLVQQPTDAQSVKQSILACFRRWDTDGSGCMSRAELGRLMRALDEKFSEADLGTLMGAVDTDRSGVIEYTEFVEWVSSCGGSLDKIASAEPPQAKAASKAAAKAGAAVSRASAKARASRRATSPGRSRSPSPGRARSSSGRGSAREALGMPLG